MTNCRPGWTVKKLGEIATRIQYGYTESATVEEVGPRFLRITDIQNGKVDWNTVPYCKCDEFEKYRLNPGDIVFARTGATTGKSFLITDCPNSVFASYLIKVQLRREVCAGYVYQFFQTPSYWSHIAQFTTGSTQGGFNASKLAQIEIPLPPLLVQKQIAAILEKADAAREKRRQANQLTEQFLQSAFLEMFGDPGSNARKLTAKRLADLVKEDDKINYGVVQPGDDYPGGVPIVRISDFKGMHVDKSNLKRIDPKIEGAYKRSRLVGDEVLLACVGSIGMVTLADPNLKGFNTVRAVARIRCGEELNRLFLAFYLSTSFSQSFFSRETRTVSQPTLNIRQIEETQIYLPPLNEQRQFAALVEKVESLRAKLRESEKELENLFQSLMQRAFKGELVG